MSFQIRPSKQFLVRPALPLALRRLPELGLNLLWSWNHTIRAVFRRLDPAIWHACGYNPVVMLGQVPQHTLERAATDPRYLALYRHACEIHDSYVAAAPADAGSMLVAYFSMEYGLIDAMAIYSGGLGVLSGDHLKAASDLTLPLVGVGLLYQNGYLEQTLAPDGWQMEKTPLNDFYSLPVTPVTRGDGSDLMVQVRLAGAMVYLKVWRVDVGRTKLYLLDSNVQQNPDPSHREITAQLYGGDLQQRIRQEIALGIGGLRALKELGLQPTVYHMNEGHSAFLALERIRTLMKEEGLSFEEAQYATRSNNLFTTHTSVPAGIDLFPPALMHEYFRDYCTDVGMRIEDLLALGRRHPNDSEEPFSMAVAAFKTSAYRNGVSLLHRRISQQMWEELWPKLPVWEVPITSITNGVHLPSWINGDLANLYDQYLQPDWREGHAEARIWEQISEIPPAELWEAHRRRKRRMVGFVRERAVESAVARKAPASQIKQLHDVLNPEALTIGFARRFATYKRATLIFRNMDRLKRILTDPARPVQIVIAGKAHPLDVPGKTLIREIVQHSRNPEFQGRIVFVENYGIQVARELVGGVDIWLNAPRRGEEACGTSGMKAGLNGVLNLSILDGWFDEAGELTGGWVIGDREPYSPDRDDAHAAAIYSLLEDEIVPMYYNNREQGVPIEWMARVKQSLAYVSTNFNCQRMVEEYTSQLYQPAHQGFIETSRGHFAKARAHSAWLRSMNEKWPRIAIVDYDVASNGSAVLSGSPVPLRATVDLAGLEPADVRVEAVVGHVGAEGELIDMQVLALAPLEQSGTKVVFGRDFTPLATGRLGCSVRVSPNHFDDPLNRPCNAPLKWADEPTA
ncbi:MAG: alpha-glucan family phosphorylase [Bryobacterales bacterium]|nr:alpha-glucan family phosphorylase [Bryobacterales bacterium]MBV9397602.1 alpha-glucan family phosphorylase [Bryobacterales bacterium]